jgi:serine/threonine-protein kinase
VTLIRLGDFAAAQTELKKAIAIAPDYAAYTNLGVLYYRQKRFADAATSMEAAQTLNDKDYLQWEDLASAYEWLGEKNKAAEARARERRLLEERLTIRPQDAMMQADLGALYAQQQQREKALPHLEAALALSPNDANTLARLGEAYEFLGQRSKAIEFLRQAVDRGYPASELQLSRSLQALLADPKAKNLLPALPSQHRNYSQQNR